MTISRDALALHESFQGKVGIDSRSKSPNFESIGAGYCGELGFLHPAPSAEWKGVPTERIDQNLTWPTKICYASSHAYLCPASRSTRCSALARRWYIVRMRKPQNPQKPPKLTFPQACMAANFYYAARDHPHDSFDQIRRRLLGTSGFRTKATTFKRECRKSFDLGRKE